MKLNEIAKWRSPEHHGKTWEDDADAKVPLDRKGMPQSRASDPLQLRQGASKTQSEKDPQSMAGKFGKKYASKHGVDTKTLMKNLPLGEEANETE